MTTPKEPNKQLVDFFAKRKNKIEQALQWILDRPGEVLPEQYDDLDTLELRMMGLDLGKLLKGAEILCHIYFDIAKGVLGEDMVRTLRDRKISRLQENEEKWLVDWRKQHPGT